MPGSNDRDVPSEYFSREYYLDACDGYNEFRASIGRELGERLRKVFDLCPIEPGQWILDIGCGRGELVLHSALRGALAVGIDYAENAMAIAREVRAAQRPEIKERMFFQQADASQFPFRPNSFEVAVMADVVEHLSPSKLTDCLEQVFSLLKPGGILVIHTAPNRWYAECSYPVVRVVKRVFTGVQLPKQPRDHWERVMHVNEQTPHSLMRELGRAGFNCRVWASSRRRSAGLLRRVLYKLYPLNLLIGTDIFAIGKRPEKIGRGKEFCDG